MNNCRVPMCNRRAMSRQTLSTELHQWKKTNEKQT
jgi:hypothetical protein